MKRRTPGRSTQSAPRDGGIQPVLDAIARTAARLCEAHDALIYQVEGDDVRLTSKYGRLRAPRAVGDTLPITRGSAAGRAVIDRKIVHIRDLERILRSDSTRAWIAARVPGVRTLLATPLLRDGVVLGVILIRRTRVRPFTAKQIALLKTFADQAAIAIENARLSNELESRNRELSEALEQQTATGEIARAISRSPTDVQPVLDAIVRSATTLCGAAWGAVFRLDGLMQTLAAHHGTTPDELTLLHRVYPRAADRDRATGRAIVDRRAVNVADLQDDPEYSAAPLRTLGLRSALAVPLLGDGAPIGALGLWRREPRPFTDKQIELLTIFADQAVIAIENARLLSALQDKNADLTESLEQQTATAEILRVISSSPTDAQPVFDAIVESAARLCDARFSSVFRFDGELITLAAYHDLTPEELAVTRAVFPARATRGTAAGRAIVERAVVHIPDIRTDPDYVATPALGALGYRTALAVPMLREGNPTGVLLNWRRQVSPFTDKQIELVKTFADQAVIAIENVRLFTELEARNRALTEALDQQTATGEILRVISRSPTVVEPVFDAIVRSAARLCDASDVSLYRREGDTIRCVSNYGRVVSAEIGETRPITRGTGSGRAILERRTVHIADALAEVAEFPDVAAAIRREGIRTVLSVPLLRDGLPIGAMTIRRTEPRPFSEAQIRLLETLADQAVIAIENVRLFSELQARNHDLTQTLDQQTATSEILRVIGSSPTDAQPVFDAIARSGITVCAALGCVVFVVDGDMLRVAATQGIPPERMARFNAEYPRPLTPDNEPARTILERKVVHLADIEHNPSATAKNIDDAKLAGYRTRLMVPMVREHTAIGVIAVTRESPMPFPDQQVELLKTFAGQAVIAIENVRLFTELQARNRQITEALEQQMGTGEILRVISNSPTDVQPVFDTIVASAVRLCRAHIGAVFQFDGGILHVVAHHNFTAEMRHALSSRYPRPPQRDMVSGRAILTRAVVQIEDVLADREYHRDLALATGWRSMIAVPMLREGEPIGAIVINRVEPGPFADTHTELLKTFADQAVIAIENVRLFKELEEKNQALTTAHARVSEALEQQVATSAILTVIASSPTDVQPVLDAVAENAARLCHAEDSSILQVDGGVLRVVAYHGAIRLKDFDGTPVNRGSVAGRAILDGQVVHVHNITDESDAEFSVREALMDHFGHSTMLATPLLRKGTSIGAIFVRRVQVLPFSDKQIELLKTFADQAVIAIENVRLFKELEQRNAALTEALEQQTATSEILRVISRSPTDVGPVFDTIAENAARLCDSRDAVIFRVDGDVLRLMASHGPIETIGLGGTLPIDRATSAGRAVADLEPIQVSDLLGAEAEFPVGAALARRQGYRTTLSTPLLRDGVALGVITIRRTEVRPFASTHVKLLQTFADQAVIAIENVRLFKELEARNRDLSEALEQQTATSDILGVISRSPTDVQPVLDAVAQNAGRLCDATDVLIYRFEAGTIRRVAHFGSMPSMSEARAVTGDTPNGRAILERRTIHLPDILEEFARGDYLEAQRLQEGSGFRTILCVPMLREATVVGTLVIRRLEVRPFTDKQIALVNTFADQAVIAIENVRLFKELEARNGELRVALEQQTVTSELLKVIGRSTFDLQPVFDTLAENAVRLCEGHQAAIFRLDGELLRVVATHNISPELRAFFETNPVAAPGRGSVAGRAALDRHTIHIHDVREDPERTWQAHQVDPIRTVLSIPMLRAGEVLGVIGVDRLEVRPFSDNQIALLETFADQAAIAIENARLLNELQTRTAQLSRSVDELTALGEVSRALSSTLDLETVLNTIVARANQLAGTDACSVWEYDEATETFSLRATDNLDPDVVAMLHRTTIGKGEGAVGSLAMTQAPVQIPDIATEDAYRGSMRDVLLRTGTRALLAVPLLRDDRLVGGLTVNKKTPGEFPPETVELLKTFATQSALAINNARLFREIEDKGRQLEIASQHKSQFLANMSHELRTPLNAILGYTELIVDNIYGEVPERMREVLERVDKSGRHLLGLINDILDLSKIEAGQLTLALGPYAMDGVAQTVATQVGALAAEKQLSFELAVADDLPIGQGDERRLTQVLLNLVGNAIKFTDVGKVVVRVATEAGSYVVSVTDTGPGIAEADREKIFEEFQQADTTRAKAKGGTGLGLAISRRIVEMHGGRLWVDSTLGEGSTFSFTVPVHVEQQVTVARQSARP